MRGSSQRCATRVRSARSIDPALETEAEAEARTALTGLEQCYAAEKARLEGELQQARQQTERLQDSQRKKIAALEQEREAFEKNGFK